MLLVTIVDHQSLFYLCFGAARCLHKLCDVSLIEFRTHRFLPLHELLLLLFKFVLVDLSFGEEWNRYLSISQVQLTSHEINAALMTLQVVQPKQEINLVVLQHCKGTHKLLAQDLHISSMHSTQNL